MSTVALILLAAAVVVLGSILLASVRNGRLRLAPRRGDQPTPTREGAAPGAAPDAEEHLREAPSERAVAGEEREAAAGRADQAR